MAKPPVRLCRQHNYPVFRIDAQPMIYSVLGIIVPHVVEKIIRWLTCDDDAALRIPS